MSCYFSFLNIKEKQSFEKNLVDLQTELENSVKETVGDDFFLKEGAEPYLRDLKQTVLTNLSQLAEEKPTSKESQEVQEHLIKIFKKIDEFVNLALKIGFEKELKVFDITMESHEHYLACSQRDDTKKMLRSILKEKMDWYACVDNPFLHPEWETFKNEFNKHIEDEGVVAELFKTLIQGIDFQNKLNEAGKKYDANPDYDLIAKILDSYHLLSPNPNESAALWSGGFDTSLYAQEKGYTTLEKTKAGKIFNNLLLYTDWGPMGPLWNAISKAFAENIKDQVHIFFRINDPTSTLDRQEMQKIKEKVNKGTICEVIFHPLINQGTFAKDRLDMREVDSLEHTCYPRIALKIALTILCQNQEASKGNDDYDNNFHQANLFGIQAMKLE